MTKREFIRRVAADNGVAIDKAKAWVDVIFDTLRDSCIDNPEVNIYGFGKFEHKVRGAKVGRLPTGEKVEIPPVTKLRFTPSLYVADAVKDGIDSMQFDDRMNKVRAIKRGEYVAGYALRKGVLVEVDVPDDHLAPIDNDSEEEDED